MNNTYNYVKLNPINPELDKSKQYKRILNFSDLFSAGYSFIIGAGIFILLPMIIKFSGGISWISFIIRFNMFIYRTKLFKIKYDIPNK